jgi:hypothetical protein
MKLIVVHQILIAAAVVLGIGFGVRGVSLFWTKGNPVDIALGIASLLIAAVLLGYLRTVREKVLAEKAAEERGKKAS